jgi:septal ring factor EnvC (AmiA/AmiB activator)
MKSKIAVVILVLVCLALGVALVTEQRKHAQEKRERDDQIALQSTDLQKTHKDLEEQKQVNMTLEGDLKSRGEDLKSLSNNLSKVIADLEKSDAQAKATAEQLRTAQAELAKKDQKINALEGERAALGKQMDQLTNSIGNLEQQIATTEKKLATSQGEKEFLVKELTRMRAEKAELERQFNDIAVLRAQVSKLKEEMAISRRLEFIRLNLFGTAKGGAEKLMPASRPPATSGTNYDLAVEVRQGGGARIVAPTNAAASTNIPKATNALPQDAPVAPPK